MAELEKLISTVSGSTPEALASLASQVQAATADSQIQASEIQASLSTLIDSLEASGTIENGAFLKQLEAASPEIADFVTGIQKSIVDAKEATPQGLLLAAQLENGDITAAQFNSLVQAISLSPSQLQAAVGVSLPAQVQALLLGLTNNSKLSTLAQLTATNPTAGYEPFTSHLNGPEWGETTPVDPPPAPGPPTLGPGAPTNPVDPAHIAPIASEAVAAQPSNVKLATKQTDTKLGNNLDFFGKMINIAAKIAEQNLKASAAALISLNPQPRVMTGARAVIRINGKVAALCTNVQYEITTEWSEIRGVDELLPSDLAPMNYSVKGSMSLYRVPNKSPVSDFLHQDMFRGVIWPYTTIELRDKRTDELIMLVKRCAITSRSEAFSKGTLTTTNLSFVGIGFRDEEAPELLPDKLSGEEESNGGTLGQAFKAISNLLS